MPKTAEILVVGAAVLKKYTLPVNDNTLVLNTLMGVKDGATLAFVTDANAIKAFGTLSDAPEVAIKAEVETINLVIHHGLTDVPVLFVPLSGPGNWADIINDDGKGTWTTVDNLDDKDYTILAIE